MKPYCCNFAVTTAETKQLADFIPGLVNTELYTGWRQSRWDLLIQSVSV